MLVGCKMSGERDGRQDEEAIGRTTEALLFLAKERELGSSA